jgi:hypothetical protein
MKNKQTKKISLFTEEEIKILLELGFESNGYIAKIMKQVYGTMTH